jgi:hypothetical protein
MCISNAVNTAMIMSMFKKAVGLKKKPDEPKAQSAAPSTAAMPKQKRRIRPSRLMRSGRGNRSFLEGGQ